eukprot:CAMPEP_0197037826 /NCGR_PEP_ID=MMETSP1384-20130603/14942_1 /TAXON_ID=29189 /ORGANISM="Ammonia sp." /LENGTH=416 /DNA_ID=CAMNT_0042468193 /DNA_START=27 /DNA_END=1277 /DNA_ORIENTATION=-
MRSRSQYTQRVALFSAVLVSLVVSISILKFIFRICDNQESEPTVQHFRGPPARILNLDSSLSLSSSNASVTVNESRCCRSAPYANIGKVINCSRSNGPLPRESHHNHIGIATMHIPNKHRPASVDVEAILNNHLSYSFQHEYIYFEITNASLVHQHQYQLAKNWPQWVHQNLRILLSKLHIVRHILTSTPSLKYLLWIDFDALFINCSNSIQKSIIAKSQQLYQDRSEMDIIFSYEPTTVANSGVVLYKNVPWTHALLQRMISMTQKYASIIQEVHLGWADQNIFIAVLMGYNDVENQYQNETEAYLKYLLSDPRYGNEPAFPNQTWQWLGDNNQSLVLHGTLDEEMAKHVALLSPFDMNLGHRYYRNEYSKRQLPHEPFVVHFAGPPSKPYIQKGTRQRQSLRIPQCSNHCVDMF